MLMGVKRTGRWTCRPERVGLVAGRRKTMWLELRWQQVCRRAVEMCTEVPGLAWLVGGTFLLV
jgi:hypothetical protein